MTEMLVKPPQLRASASNLCNHINAFQSALQNVDNIILALPNDQFEGLSSIAIYNRYMQKREYLLSAQKMALEFAVKLEQIADKFEQADKALNAKGAAVVGSGQVLGASITLAVESLGAVPAEAGLAALIEKYKNMRWSEKLGAEKQIDKEIARLTGLIPPEGKIKEINSEISGIDQQIAEINRKREAAVKDSKNLLNQIIPDLPLQRDTQDGLPWRVKADDYEDQIADYDRQLADLSQTRAALDGERAVIHSNIVQLDQLKLQKQSVSQVINGGIPSDGPTGYQSGFGGCTNYVAGKRDLDPGNLKSIGIHGNAQDWLPSAVKGGWDVGKQPVKGSIMVFQGEASAVYHTADRKTGGHVAYVENVSVTDKGTYQVTISEASTLWDKNGNYIPGTHSKVSTRTVEIPADGHKYVDFIYDHPAK